MARRYLCILALVISAFSANVAVAAPVGSPVTLAFGATYRSSDGGEAVHQGADVACGDGESVEAPVRGVVTFAGRIPAVSGGSTLAVTIRVGDDLITLMPLSAVAVRKGQSLEVGEPLGTAAASGDPSSAGTHIHVSMRRGGVHLDPAALLVPSSLPEAAETAPAAAVPPAEAIVAPQKMTPGAVSVPEPVTSPVEHAGVCAPSTVLVAEAAPSNAGNAASQAEAELAPKALSQSTFASPRASETPARTTAHEDFCATAARQAGAIIQTPFGVAALLVAFVSVGLLLSRRALERRLQSETPVSDRLETMLQHMRAGAKLCGLTSCSGLLPSQSRSRIAQRR